MGQIPSIIPLVLLAKSHLQHAQDEQDDEDLDEQTNDAEHSSPLLVGFTGGTMKYPLQCLSRHVTTEAQHVLRATLGAGSEDETEKDESLINSMTAVCALHLALTRRDKLAPPNISVATHQYLQGNLQKG